MLAMLIAKGVETDQKEHFYEAPYLYREDDVFYKELMTLETHEEFLIPEPNPFIPKSFCTGKIFKRQCLSGAFNR